MSAKIVSIMIEISLLKLILIATIIYNRPTFTPYPFTIYVIKMADRLLV